MALHKDRLEVLEDEVKVLRILMSNFENRFNIAMDRIDQELGQIDLDIKYLTSKNNNKQES